MNFTNNIFNKLHNYNNIKYTFNLKINIPQLELNQLFNKALRHFIKSLRIKRLFMQFRNWQLRKYFF